MGQNDDGSKGDELDLERARLISENGRENVDIPMCGFMSVRYYQPYFNVDTPDIISRIAQTVFYCRREQNFLAALDGRPDAYGPFWVSSRQLSDRFRMQAPARGFLLYACNLIPPLCAPSLWACLSSWRIDFQRLALFRSNRNQRVAFPMLADLHYVSVCCRCGISSEWLALLVAEGSYNVRKPHCSRLFPPPTRPKHLPFSCAHFSVQGVQLPVHPECQLHDLQLRNLCSRHSVAHFPNLRRQTPVCGRPLSLWLLAVHVHTCCGKHFPSFAIPSVLFRISVPLLLNDVLPAC